MEAVVLVFTFVEVVDVASVLSLEITVGLLQVVIGIAIVVEMAMGFIVLETVEVVVIVGTDVTVEVKE